MTRPQPSREDHERFCEVEGRSRVRDARGRSGTHHVTYRLDLPDGTALRSLVRLLISRVGLAEKEIRQMTKDEGIARLKAFWTEGK